MAQNWLSFINHLAVGSCCEAVRCCCWTGMLGFLPEPCSGTAPALTLASVLALERAHSIEMVSCLLCHTWKLFPLNFSSSLFSSCYLQQQLNPPLVKLQCGFLLKCCLCYQTVAALEVHAMKDSVLLISDSYSCTSNKNLFAVFLYTHVVVSVQISAILILITGEMLMINIPKMVHKARSLAVICEA